MSYFSYFCRRSAILLLKSSVLWILACIVCVLKNILHCGLDLFVSPFCCGSLWNDVFTVSIWYAIIAFVLWLVWTLFIFSLPPKSNSFTKDDPRLAKIQNTPEGRFVCKPELRRMDGYVGKSKKFYFFRLGEQLPNHLKLIRVPDNTIVQFCNCNTNELRAVAKIDMTNHGYNALIDCAFSFARIDYINYTSVRGRPALIVSENYSGDINLLENRCSDTFDRLIYGKSIHNEDP